MSQRISELEIHNNDRLYREVLKDYFPPRLAVAILGESGSYGSGPQRALRGVVVAHIALVDALESALGVRLRPVFRGDETPVSADDVEERAEATTTRPDAFTARLDAVASAITNVPLNSSPTPAASNRGRPIKRRGKARKRGAVTTLGAGTLPTDREEDAPEPVN